MIFGFIYLMYPHIFLIPRWVSEEPFIFRQTQDIGTSKITFGVTIPILTQLIVYFTNTIFSIDLRTIAVMFNPFVCVLTVVPLYYLARKYLTNSQSLVACLFWAFSESVFYRSATYESTEPLAIFLCICSLAFYVRKKYVPAFAFLVISFASHMLPGAYTVGVIVIDLFLNASKTKKLISISLCLIFVIFLMSPLNTDIKQQARVNPITLLSKFKITNILIYSTSDILSGVFLFLGSVSLVALSLSQFVLDKFKVNKFILSMLIASFGLFFFSWMFYSPSVFAPPRLTIYFIIPLSFLSSIIISSVSGYKKQLIITVILITMIVSAFNGLNTFLTVKDALTENEYKAIDDLYKSGIIKDSHVWFADYPAINYITCSDKSISFLYVLPVNDTKASRDEKLLYNFVRAIEDRSQKNVTSTDGVSVPSRYNYIFVSERMKNSAFFNVVTSGRAYQTHFQFNWAESGNWTLIYNRYGVQAYKRVGSP